MLDELNLDGFPIHHKYDLNHHHCHWEDPYINQQHHHRPYHPHHHPHVNISIKLDWSQVLCGRFNFPALPFNNAHIIHPCISRIKSPLYSKLHPVSNNAHVIHSRISSIKSSVYSKLHPTISLFRCPLYPMSQLYFYIHLSPISITYIMHIPLIRYSAASMVEFS